jgi:hypothetical protein
MGDEDFVTFVGKLSVTFGGIVGNYKAEQLNDRAVFL